MGLQLTQIVTFRRAMSRAYPAGGRGFPLGTLAGAFDSKV